MGNLRTSVAALAALFATGAVALPYSPVARAELFATCAGRLAALERHQWLVDGPASEITGGQRAAMVDLLDAVLPDAHAQGLPETQAMAWRVGAMSAMSRLLHDAVFAADPVRAAPARDAASALIAACTGLLPSA